MPIDPHDFVPAGYVRQEKAPGRIARSRDVSDLEEYIFQRFPVQFQSLPGNGSHTRWRMEGRKLSPGRIKGIAVWTPHLSNARLTPSRTVTNSGEADRSISDGCISAI